MQASVLYIGPRANFRLLVGPVISIEMLNSSQITFWVPVFESILALNASQKLALSIFRSISSLSQLPRPACSSVTSCHLFLQALAPCLAPTTSLHPTC